jgi:hypothetical protein
VPDLSTDRLDVSVTESSDAAMGAAQQELVQLEHGYIKNVAELSFETTGVGSDAAQIVVSGNHGQSGAGGAADAPHEWSTGRGVGHHRGLSVELQRRHDCFLCRTSAGFNLLKGRYGRRWSRMD